jgi:hypothetical protein
MCIFVVDNKKILNMKYTLEIELADNKSAFVEEFFSSVTFIKKIKKVPDEETVIPREHWTEAAKSMHRAGDDNLLMPETLDEENSDWTWEE